MGPSYSVCWLESFTPVLGFVRVCVPVKAKGRDVNDPRAPGAGMFCLRVPLAVLEVASLVGSSVGQSICSADPGLEQGVGLLLHRKNILNSLQWELGLEGSCWFTPQITQWGLGDGREMPRTLLGWETPASLTYLGCSRRLLAWGWFLPKCRGGR